MITSKAKENAGKHSFLLTKPMDDFRKVAERIERMGRIDSITHVKGQLITGTGNVKVALFRPLGRVAGGEDSEAVKELGPPNSLQYIATALIAKGHEVRIFDQLAMPYDPANPGSYPMLKTTEQMADEIVSWNPDVLMATSFTCQFRQGLMVASRVKQELGIPIVFGGYHATDVGNQHKIAQRIKGANPEGAVILEQDMRNLFQHGTVDFAVIGDGIGAAPEVVEVLQGKRAAHEVKGLAFCDKGSIVLTQQRERIPMGDYPALYWPEDYEPRNYYATGRNYPFVLMTTSQGCRFQCSFCATPITHPGGAAYMHPEMAIEELRRINSRLGSSWPAEKIMVNLTNEDWMADPKQVIAFCTAVREAGLHERFEFNSFGTLIDAARRGEEMLAAMRKAGWSFFFYGLESTIDATARDWKRPDGNVKDRLAMAQQAIDKTNRAGIMPFIDFIAGHPEQTGEQIIEDYNRLLSLRMAPYAYMPTIAPMPGTPFYWEVLWGLKGRGFIDGITYDELDANHQVLHMADGSAVRPLRDRMVQQMYTRPEYMEDAELLVSQHKHMGKFFANMLRKIAGDYPGNQRLQEIAKKVSRW